MTSGVKDVEGTEEKESCGSERGDAVSVVVCLDGLRPVRVSQIVIAAVGYGMGGECEEEWPMRSRSSKVDAHSAILCIMENFRSFGSFPPAGGRGTAARLQSVHHARRTRHTSILYS